MRIQNNDWNAHFPHILDLKHILNFIKAILIKPIHCKNPDDFSNFMLFKEKVCFIAKYWPEDENYSKWFKQ